MECRYEAICHNQLIARRTINTRGETLSHQTGI